MRYKKAINNVKAYIKSPINQSRIDFGGAVNAFQASEILAIAFCKNKEEIFFDLTDAKKKKEEPIQTQPVDELGNIIEAGDIVDVQSAGEFKVYEENGELWFTPYGTPERPLEYFREDMLIVKKVSK